MILALLLAAASPAPVPDKSVGIWQNPQGSVRVQSRHCGANMCGTVVWANDKAKADAAKGGTANLIGLDLFQNFSVDAKGLWHGKVYVPDIGKTFTGTVTVVNENTLKGEGCLIGHLGCKSQVWTRVMP
jgi:uncharacterized protein (DUF2147 family)